MDVNVSGIGFGLVFAVIMHSCTTEQVTRINDTAYHLKPTMWGNNKICQITNQEMTCVDAQKIESITPKGR
jgi:hypothetical protein